MCTTHNAISYFIRDSANESYKLVSIGRADGGRSKWSRHGRLSLKGRAAERSSSVERYCNCNSFAVVSSFFATRYEEVETPGPERVGGKGASARMADARVDQWPHRTNERIYGAAERRRTKMVVHFSYSVFRTFAPKPTETKTRTESARSGAYGEPRGAPASLTDRVSSTRVTGPDNYLNDNCWRRGINCRPRNKPRVPAAASILVTRPLITVPRVTFSLYATIIRLW